MIEKNTLSTAGTVDSAFSREWSGVTGDTFPFTIVALPLQFFKSQRTCKIYKIESF